MFKRLLDALVSKLFDWGFISKWLIALCLWAIAMQAIYPIANPVSFMAWINIGILVLCLFVLLIRLLARHWPEKPALTRFRPILIYGDILALVFIGYGLLLYLNGTLDTSQPSRQSSEVLALIEEPFHIGKWGHPTYVGLRFWKNPSNEEYVWVRQDKPEHLLLGQLIFADVCPGVLGIPWISNIETDQEGLRRKAWRMAPDDPQIVKFVIANDLIQKRWQEVLAGSEKYLQENPGDSQFAVMTADGLSRMGRSKEAVSLLEHLVAQRANYKVYLALAGHLRSAGNLAREAEFLQTALKMDPDNFEGYYMLAYALKDLGRDEEALVAFERMLAISPGYPGIEQQMAQIRQRKMMR